ncbi:serine/threonine protein kinase [Micromonospora ureilytica]|uniref:serine/threonine-protein kinase n=1 Tax=Micromonospora ureilytica TaxID=709868 RepID=UPI002E0F117F|nr:serine/threonine protein kinase [Micromonospora ureilytica]
MGQVWFGRDTRLDREVAVKFIRFPDDGRDEVLVRRFHRESRVMARLEHPGVPAVYDWGEDGDRPFLVMQRVRGITVHDLVSEQVTLPIGWAAAIAAQVCAVLSAAHAARLVHRDLKPANLMVEPSGTVKVLDFGLSVAPTLSDFSKITHSGQSPGTPAYMAPEQLLDGKEPGPASDLYALGCTLHEMVCGERPFTGSTSYHLMNQHARDNPPALRDLRPEVPARLERLVLDLLAKRPEDRPASAEVVYERLLPFVSNLGTLAGVINPRSQPSPIRMYAGVLSRVFADAPPDVPPRHRSATDAVDIEPTGDGATDDGDNPESRLQLADMWFDRGDYPNAGRAYADIATELDTSEDADRLLYCGKREATCYSRVGDGHRALRKLEQLLRDFLPVLETGDTRIAQLQREIGLLQLSTGQRREARRTFGGLSREQ